MRRHLRPPPFLMLVVGIVALGVAPLDQAGTATQPTPAPAPESSSTTPVAETVSTATLAPARNVDAPTPAVTAAESDVDTPTTSVGEVGMMVGVDPETGRIGKPSAEVRQRLEATLPDPALDRSMDGIEIIHRPDGSMMADLKGRFQDYTVIRITPDGRKIESCVQGPQVETALQADEKPAPAPQHEVR